MGETRVDLLHLLEDLRDAYTGSLEETILTEIVANSLDSGTGEIGIAVDPAPATVTIVDDGRGMTRREFTRYHDIAASTKIRGQGIGFAGVGIKLGLLACEEVVTETRRGKTHVASTWRLSSRHRAPWKRIPPTGLVTNHGTGVRLKLKNPLSPLLDAGFAVAVLERHFAPLLDPAFEEILSVHYPRGVRLLVNGDPLAWRDAPGDRAPISIRIGRRRKPAAVGYLIRDAGISDERGGIAISTLGKVIKRGWEWLGISPAAPDQVSGLIEVPALAGCLSLNKADFIRSGSQGGAYLAFRKAIQEAVAAQLAAWGEGGETAAEDRRRRVRPVERDLQAVLTDLADDFPLLSSLVERHLGGQRRLPVGGRGKGEIAAVPVPVDSARGGGNGGETGAMLPPDQPEPEGVAPEQAPSPAPDMRAGDEKMPPLEDASAKSGKAAKRPARYGLSIRFENRPQDPGLGRLVESTVWVNEAHPAYRRAVASRSEGYHLALSVAMALASIAIEPHQAHEFITAFLGRWGSALERPAARRSRSRQRGLALE